MHLPSVAHGAPGRNWLCGPIVTALVVVVAVALRSTVQLFALGRSGDVKPLLKCLLIGYHTELTPRVTTCGLTLSVYASCMLWAWSIGATLLALASCSVSGGSSISNSSVLTAATR